VTLATLAILAVAIVISFVDRRMASQMAADAARFQTLADGAFEGVVIHRDGVILDSNPAFKAMFGACADCASARLTDFVESAALAAAEADPNTPIETTLRRGAGESFQAEISGRSIQLRDGSPGRLLAIRDVSARKKAEARLNHLALHDQLTDLPNRRLFIELANKEIAHAKRHGRQFAVHALDLDGFKLVNDMHGHEAGDALLGEISRRLAACLRDEDVVARFGGDEFAIIEMGTRQPSDAAIVAERVLDAIRQPIALPDAEAVISGSIGVAVYPDDGETIEALLRNADTAMYRAKADGKGVFKFFEAEMDAALVTRRKLENRLRRAIAEERLEVFYQPLVASVTQEPLGFEALLRWRDEELGHVSPGEFIPVAEETGLIIPLGDFVLRRATADAAAWPDGLRVAVNLSAVQFKRPGLVQTVKNALAASGLPGSRLDLEITESILIDNREQVLTTLRQLKEMGIRISLDDFGTGYSSLRYLQSFPFEKITIDRVFVSDLQESHSNSSIIQAVVAMGQSLSMKVVAEGVETAEQAELLGVLHCDELQGFHIARPMAAADIPSFLSSATTKRIRSVA
ncbi:MAG: EAL domain-containing protein, partial [Alphaproteobacteria bacterium]